MGNNFFRRLPAYVMTASILCAPLKTKGSVPPPAPSPDIQVYTYETNTSRESANLAKKCTFAIASRNFENVVTGDVNTDGSTTFSLQNKSSMGIQAIVVGPGAEGTEAADAARKIKRLCRIQNRLDI